MIVEQFAIGETATLTMYQGETGINNGPQKSVLLLPGGSYLYVSKREGEAVAYEFLRQGYTVFILNYTTAGTILGESSRNKLYQYLMKLEDSDVIGSEFPNPLIEAASAMKFIRENNHKFNVDSDHVGVVGFSAGGHLAATLGVHWNSEWLRELTGFDNNWAKPNFIVLGYPILDYSLNETIAESRGSIDPNFKNMAKRVTFGNDFDVELLNKATPKNFVSKDTPKTFIWHTTGDRLVYVKNVLDYANELDAYGIEFELHIFSGGEHGMSTASEIVNKENENIKIWVPLLFNWLNSHIKKDA
ncbi:alpha/beta hydrolase [Phocicoccus pinnipedialis]|uniref:Acetylxylan esterase n=1 Tax=Phocicoccus pinnipedialis TaxID=110845 RepID=A0A6V7RD94_9BACL|nr:alpha/beta hydrolase [Jeotgalicoccus pinnipedialis]MBP1939523.1 acetyl esterase/lipase [Jeotgalicoccus pinnipedialis]CAD2075032.1 Acetylxylan esterase precursor [Jeotgalicoccus pinnipedialis]